MEKRPVKSEYDAYFSKYVNLVPDGDILKILEQQNKETTILFKDISDTQGLFKYSPNKWSLKEVIGHLTDTERILGYTLLCIARGEAISLPSYDKNVYVQSAAFDKQSMEDLLVNLTIVRKSTLQLLKSLNSEDWLRRGIANGSEVSVRALVIILAGHELHHRKIINEFYIGSVKTEFK
ncbi:DinB family protein [Neobacillus pocheonensis]|uniref:DinB family protein n=1 Tax=Neobacillus pocheonensis TaxID=363869 RepID=A0ABT0W981_9BACI|nr:DinB family protein [Neobacillus pocheonensis]